MFKLMDIFHPSILLTKFWRMSKRYVFMWDAATCDVSNNPDDEDLDESSPIQYRLASSPQFENIKDLGYAI